MNIRMIGFFLTMMFVVPSGMYAQDFIGVESNEQIILKKLQSIIEVKARDARDTSVQIQISTNNKKNALSWSIASVAGLITVFILMKKWNVVQRPESFVGFLGQTFKIMAGGALGGGFIGVAYYPIINFIVTMIEASVDDETQTSELIKKDALLEFVRRWPEFKQYAPSSLAQTFDDLYANYMKQGALLVFTDQDVAHLIDTILIECINEHTKKIGDVGA